MCTATSPDFCINSWSNLPKDQFLFNNLSIESLEVIMTPHKEIAFLLTVWIASEVELRKRHLKIFFSNKFFDIIIILENLVGKQKQL